MVKMLLEGWGYGVLTASNGKETLSQLRGTDPVLLNVIFPDISGWIITHEFSCY